MPVGTLEVVGQVEKPRGGETYARADGGLDVVIGPPSPRDPEPLTALGKVTGLRVAWCSPTGYERDPVTRQRVLYRVIGERRYGHAIPGVTSGKARADTDLYVPIVPEAVWHEHAGQPPGQTVTWVPDATLWLY